jgi:tetratricopeptide (TPR) repeat protein
VINTKLYGLETSETLDATENLALSLCALGQVEEAERLLQDVVRLREKNCPDECSIANTKSHLSTIWGIQGYYEKAEKIKMEVIRWRRSALGPDHPATLIALNGLAKILREQERYEESKRLKLEVLAGRMKVLGASHPDTKRVQEDLVCVLIRESFKELTSTRKNGPIPKSSRRQGPIITFTMKSKKQNRALIYAE